MRQCYPEEMQDAPTGPPSKRVKEWASSRRPNFDKSVAESSPLMAQDGATCQNEEQAMLTVQAWTKASVELMMRLCTERQTFDEVLRGYQG